MTIFDQRYQKVTYQYNAAGNINFDVVQNRADALEELEKLQAELDRAVKVGVFDEDSATDAEYQLRKAVQQAKKPEPVKKTILGHLNQAKDVISGVAATVGAATGLVAAFEKAIEVVQKFF